MTERTHFLTWTPQIGWAEELKFNYGILLFVDAESLAEVRIRQQNKYITHQVRGCNEEILKTWDQAVVHTFEGTSCQVKDPG